VERIGDKACKWYDVPFIRSRPDLKTEMTFWGLPDDLQPLLLQFGLDPPPRHPVHEPTPTPVVTYTNVSRSIKRKTVVSTKSRKAPKSRDDSSDSSYDGVDDDDEEDDVHAEHKDAELPAQWPGSKDKPEVGLILVQQVVYAAKKGKDKGGIALSQVHLFCDLSTDLSACFSAYLSACSYVYV